jgi:conjugal transfer pilus assembly protein TraV
MKNIWIMILLIVILPLSGCQILNPYDAKSDCPDPYNGDCVSMETAYRRSKKDPNNNKEYQKIDAKHDSPLIKDRPETRDNSNISQLNTDRVYKHELYQEIAGLVKQPITPVRVPAKLMRVLVLGYDREDRFYSHRYVFFESDKPRWILNIIEE